MKLSMKVLAASVALMSTYAFAKTNTVSDAFIAKERAALAANPASKDAGPQAPRDLGSKEGTNKVTFAKAPSYKKMNLCNIHFHKNAEHKGGDFTTYAGNGNGKGYFTGYKFDGKLSESDMKPVGKEICPHKKGGLFPGDTIELHYVHSSANVKPGPTLGSCLSKENQSPDLRVETQVFVLANDKNATDFLAMVDHGVVDGFQQAYNIPSTTGTPIEYFGSTTGPSYNTKPSPFKVNWSVRPKVVKLNIESVGKWCEGNVFKEDHAHGVRNLVTNPALLSPIK